MARIEVAAKDIERLASPKIREAVYKKFRELGFLFVAVDMHGYSTGSMNATLEQPPKNRS